MKSKFILNMQTTVTSVIYLKKRQRKQNEYYSFINELFINLLGKTLRIKNCNQHKHFKPWIIAQNKIISLIRITNIKIKGDD